MSNYAQILKSKAQGRRQWWYICGGVPALVQDAYELALSHVHSVNVGVEKSVFVGPETSLEQLEDALTRYFDGERHVIVLHEAEKFDGWSELTTLLRKTDSSRFFIAVSNADPPSTKEGSWARLFVGNQKSRFVVCQEMSPVEKSIWVQSRLSISREAESYLITRSHGDYYWLLSQIRKLEYLEVEEISLKLVQGVCPSQGDPDFIESLVHQRYVAALAAVSRGLIDETTLPRLSTLLHNLATIKIEYDVVGLQPRLVTERTGMHQNEISVYGKAASYYDQQATTKAYVALAKLYEGLRAGSQNAYIALVTRW